MINIIIDSSGSMYEDDKMSAVKYYLYTFIKKAKDYKLYTYDSSSDNLNEIKEIKDIKYASKFNFNSIVKFINENKTNINLFLTDGLFEISNTEIDKEIQMYFISFGEDSDVYTLEKLSNGEVVYSGNNCIKLINKLSRVETNV